MFGYGRGMMGRRGDEGREGCRRVLETRMLESKQWVFLDRCEGRIAI